MIINTPCSLHGATTFRSASNTLRPLSLRWGKRLALACWWRNSTGYWQGILPHAALHFDALRCTFLRFCALQWKRKSLEHIDWNYKMKNKTATECWNIGELDSAIDSFVPMKKHGKWSKKKHLSKEAFRKITYKQNMWRVYKHTGKDRDYEVYKDTLNAATNGS